MPRGWMRGIRWSHKSLYVAGNRCVINVTPSWRPTFTLNPCINASGFSTSTAFGKRVLRKSERDEKATFRVLTESEYRVKTHNLFDPRPDSDSNNGSSYQRLSPDFHEPDHSSRHRTAPAAMRHTDSAALEDEMLWYATKKPHSARLSNILELLICERREIPEAAHYEAAIRWQASPNLGSASNVRLLMNEMKERGIALNAIICTGILRTMVAHPDIEIVQEVIETCEKLWISLDRDILHLICAAYLRAGMAEMALEYLEKLESTDMPAETDSIWMPLPTTMTVQPVDVWLYVLFIQHFVQIQDGDALLNMCYRLSDDTSVGIPFASRQMDVAPAFWNWVLQMVVEHNIGDTDYLIAWLWDTWVQNGMILPDRNLISKILQRLTTGTETLSPTAVKVLSLDYFCTEPEVIQSRLAELKAANAEATSVQGVSSSNIGASPQSPVEMLRNYLKQTSENERAAAASVWSLFYDKPGPDGKLYNPSRVNPWAYLTKAEDRGTAWARVERQLTATAQRRKTAEATRRFIALEREMYKFMEGLPPGMIQDIEDLEMALLPDDVKEMHKSQTPGRKHIHRMDHAGTVLEKYIKETTFDQLARERKRVKAIAATMSARFQ